MVEDSKHRGITRLAPYTPWLILAYFAARVVSRVFVSPTVDIDEGEQLVLSQALSWGYGTQPPLYTWLQTGLFAVLGRNVLALALLKNALFALTLYLTFRAVRSITGRVETACLATMSLFLLPPFAWRAQLDATHTVLVVACAAFTLFAFCRVLREGRVTDYALLGVAWGAGLLSKHNFVLFALPLTVAAATLPEFRMSVWNRRLVLSVAIALLIVLPFGLWILEHRELAVSGMDRFYVARNQGPIDLLGTAASVLFLPILVLVLAALRSRRREPSEGLSHARLLVRGAAIGFVLCVVGAIAADVSSIRGRWLLPVFYGVPIGLVLALRPRLTQGRVRIVLVVATVIAAGVLVLFPLRVVYGPRIGDPRRLNSPFPTFVRQIRDLGFRRGVIETNSQFVAGNLMLAFPESAAAVHRYPQPAVEDDAWRLVAWFPTTRFRIPESYGHEPHLLRARRLYGGKPETLAVIVTKGRPDGR